MKKPLILLAVLVLAVFTLAACGDDDDENGETAATTTEETTETGDGGGGGAETVSLSADPDGQLAYDTTELSAQAGDLTIELDNPAQIPHDVCLENPDGEDVGCSETITADSTSLEANVESGDYTFYCSVNGHREAGMEGTLSVE